MPPPTCCRWWPPTGSARKWPSDSSAAMRFYGSSFICDHKGALLAEADRDSSGVWLHDLDLAHARRPPELGHLPRPPPGNVRAAADPGRPHPHTERA
jgi:N-carbamoylputrescine amidase